MKKIDRRDFLKVAGGAVVGGGAGFVLSGAPFDAFQWVVEWTQDQVVPSPGEERFITGICHACPNKCAIRVRMIDDRAVKIETENKGCSMGQALVQWFYHPERVKYPLKRVGKKGSGKFAPVKWDEAIQDITTSFNKLRKEGKADSLAAITNPHTMRSTLLLERLLRAAGSPHLYTESCMCNLSRAAVKHLYNLDGALCYDLENADYILSFSARLLEGWGQPYSMHKAFLNWKKTDAKLVQVDTLCSRTASLANEWIPLKPGTELTLALGIAYHLLRKGKTSRGTGFADWSQMVFNYYTPDNVSKITGVPIETISRIAGEFAEAKRPLAVAGRGGTGISSSAAEIIAIQTLNDLVESTGKTGGVSIKLFSTLGDPPADDIARASLEKATRSKGLDDFIASEIDPGILIINEANPVHRSTHGKKLVEKMQRTPLVISLSTLINDTAHYSDYILPTLTALERIGESAPVTRSQSLCAGEIILKIARGIEGVADAFPWSSRAEIDFPEEELITPRTRAYSADIFKEHLKQISAQQEQKEYPLALIPFEVPAIGDGVGLAFPYVLKSIDGKIFSYDKLWVHMHPETAEKDGLSEGSKIDLISKRGEIGSVRVHLTKLVAPGVVAVPLGFGHTSYTKYGSDKGVNPKEIMTADIDPISGTADWWLTRIQIS